MRVRFVFPVVIAAALLSSAGCDTSFKLFDEGAGTYSVFGYLDANADTQFVRVEPLQDTTFAGTEEPLNVRVTTENVTTGETVVWDEDQFDVGPALVRNVFAEADLEPGATYRFTVEPTGEDLAGRERTPAFAEVTLPESFPEPELENIPDFGGPGVNPVTTLLMPGVEALGAMRVDYVAEVCLPVPDGSMVCNREEHTDFHLRDTTRTDEGVLKIDIPWVQDIKSGRRDAEVRDLFSFRIIIAVVSEDWPEFAEDNPPGDGPEGQPLPPPSINTNIEGGTGFLGGAFTRTVDVPILGREQAED